MSWESFLTGLESDFWKQLELGKKYSNYGRNPFIHYCASLGVHNSWSLRKIVNLKRELGYTRTIVYGESVKLIQGINILCVVGYR